jgi:hypothetical protein
MSVLPYFRGFFQITSSPIQEQAPIAFLRYKAVNNFQTPSRDFQYLIRISDLQKIKGATSLPSLVRLYKEEFDVSDEVAHARVSTFISEREKHSVVNPETLEYTQKDNPGIDIAIFGKHPYYTFHIYRVDSVLNLRRIKTLLSLLVTVSPDTFSSQQTAAVLEEAELEEEAAAEGEAATEAAEADSKDVDVVDDIKGEMKAIVTAAAADDTAVDADIFDDGLGDFGGFGDELEFPAPSASAPGALAAAAAGSDAMSVASGSAYASLPRGFLHIPGAPSHP